MNFVSLIEAKRDGRTLSADELEWCVGAITRGEVPDYQASAFLMAVYFRGLSREETATLTRAMRDSGEKLVFPQDPRPLVDKHSTGGVGDKVSLVLAPLLACLGFRVPMISGRGLGITGGTLDKLDAVPGARSVLPRERVIEIVQECGCVIAGQTERMVPADRKLYALRDVTGTVPSIPLIVASILSKKLAENLDALVLDVKFGRAAFMRTYGEARELAERMVELGRDFGVDTAALLTRMDVPLGRSAGNWLEIKECAACLAGNGPSDLRELVLTCAGSLLTQTGNTPSVGEGRKRAAAILDGGEAQSRFFQMLRAQGADLEQLQEKLSRDHTADAVRELRASRSGFIVKCDSWELGALVRDLGGGRLTKDSQLDLTAGIDMLAKPGESVAQGQIIGRVHARSAQLADAGLKRLASALEVGDTVPELPPLVADQL